MAKSHDSYRILPSSSVKSGDWHHFATCPLCDRNVYLIREPKGAMYHSIFPNGRLAGGGVMSILCDACNHNFDQVIDTFGCEAARWSRDSFKTKRGNIDKASRQKLLPYFKKEIFDFGPYSLEKNSAAAQKIARMLELWTWVDVELGLILSTALQTNSAPAAAIYESLRTSRLKAEVLTAAINAVFPEEQSKLFSALLKWRNSLSSSRNDMAHGCFGYSPNQPSYIAWCKTEDYLVFRSNSKNDLLKATEYFQTKQYVYSLGTLERICREMEVLLSGVSDVGLHLYQFVRKVDASMLSASYNKASSHPFINDILTQ